MPTLIDKFYTQQQETLDQLNGLHKYFVGKTVDATINRPGEEPSVMQGLKFNGYAARKGELYANFSAGRNKVIPVRLEKGSNMTLTLSR